MSESTEAILSQIEEEKVRQQLANISPKQKETFFAKVHEMTMQASNKSRGILYIIILAVARYFEQGTDNWNNLATDNVRTYLALGLATTLILVPGIPFGDLLGVLAIWMIIRENLQTIIQETMQFAVLCANPEYPLSKIPSGAQEIVRKAATGFMQLYQQGALPESLSNEDIRMVEEIKNEMANTPGS